VAVNVKISNLPPATTPLTGAELMPVVQGGVTKKVAVGGTIPAAQILNTPAGTVAATNVQSAINEIVSDLAASSGSSLVGFLQAGSGAVATTVQAKLRESRLSVKDFGAVGDGVADDTAAIQAAIDAMPVGGGRVYLPSGTYKLTAPISIPSNKNGGSIFGDGDSTILQSTSGLTAIFLMAGQGYYRLKIESMRLNGGNIAGVPAFDCSPSVVTNIVAGTIFHRIRITNFIYGWKFKNAQLDVFYECNFDGGGVGTAAVFYIVPDSGTGQQCNANRVQHLRVTGPNVHTMLTVLPTNTERATNWLFDSCDFQQSGNTITPITILDSYYTITNCEFENYTGDNLIEVRSDNLLAPINTKIENNILAGGGAGGNGKILLNRTGSQFIQYTIISQNDAGSPSTKLCDSTSRYTLFMNNVGTINDTVPQYNMFIGGSAAAGSGTTVGFETQNRIIDGRKTFPYDGNLNFDASLGNEFVCTVTGGAALAMNAPTNPRTGQRITIRFRNTSGGAMGTITWNAVFKLAAWTNPANGFSRAIDFDYDGTDWIEVGRTPADVPN